MRDERGAQFALTTSVLASDSAVRKALAVAEPSTIQSVENHSARLHADFGLVLTPPLAVVTSTGAATTGSQQLLASVAPETPQLAERSRSTKPARPSENFLLS